MNPKGSKSAYYTCYGYTHGAFQGRPFSWHIALLSLVALVVFILAVSRQLE
jgi:hypothetical protein